MSVSMRPVTRRRCMNRGVCAPRSHEPRTCHQAHIRLVALIDVGSAATGDDDEVPPNDSDDETLPPDVKANSVTNSDHAGAEQPSTLKSPLPPPRFNRQRLSNEGMVRS